MSPWVLLLTSMNQIGACQAVNADRIFAANLAWAVPAFSVIPRDTIIGYSPAPGSRRVFQYPELKHIGARYGIDPPENATACFEWEMRPTAEQDVRTAILESLHLPSTRVEIMDMSKGLAPVGKLEFPVSGLSAPAGIDPATPVIWRGYVLYAGQHRYSVWARVKVSTTMTRVVAIQSLPPGEEVLAPQVRLETYEGFPLGSNVARVLEEVVGRIPHRTIRAGLPVLRTDLGEPFDIQRGEMVEVTAAVGAAHIELDAIAEGSGRRGERITLRNPRSGKIFRVRIDGKGKATVVTGHGGLVARVQ